MNAYVLVFLIDSLFFMNYVLRSNPTNISMKLSSRYDEQNHQHLLQEELRKTSVEPAEPRVRRVRRVDFAAQRAALVLRGP